MITRKDIAAHLEKNIRTGFLIGYKAYTPKRGAFCQDLPSDGAFEIYGDMGAVPWPRQNAGKLGNGVADGRTQAPVNGGLNSGGSVSMADIEERAQIIYNVDWEIVISITHNAIDDDRAGDVLTKAQSAAVNFQKHQDYMAFTGLNLGEAATFIGNAYDGLPLFSASHVDAGAEYQTTQSNKLTTALSNANYNAARIAGSKLKDGRGQPVGLNHNLLIYPPDLRDPAAQVLNNPFKDATANRDVNPYAGMADGLEAPGGWLDATAWYIVDTSVPQKPLGLQVRKQPELVIWDDETTGDGGTRYFKWQARYNILAGDWRLVVQGNT